MFFEILYKLLTWFIFVPVNYFILNSFMKKMGVYNITNKQLVKFGLTYEGILYMALILIFSFVALYFEIGVLTYISKKSHNRQQGSPLEGILNSITMIPKLSNVYLICFVLISTIIGPLTGLGLYTSLARSLSMPEFIKRQLSKTQGGEFIFVLAIILMIIILLRWILAIPALVIEDVSLKAAFKHSADIYKRNRIKIMAYIIGWIIINYGLKIFMLGGCVGAGLFFIYLVEGNILLQEVITNSSLIMFFIGYIVISLITLPLFISFLVELYYKYRFYPVREKNFAPQGFFKDNKSYKTFKRYRDNFMAVVLIIFIVVTGSMGLSIVFNKVVEKEVQITAHRGSSIKAPENSVSAVVEAIGDGADYAEIDVMTTKDDVVVLFHDNTLKRFDGTSRMIKNLTLDEVKVIDIGSKFGKEFKGEGIPTLEEILNLSRDNIKLNIELKPRKKDDMLAELVANMITEEGLEDQVIISSQNYESLQRVKDINPLIDVGFIVTFGIGDLSKLNVDFISVEYGMAKQELVYTMHALDKEVHVWTINDKKKAENAIKLGVDNIITDNVGLLQRTQVGLQEKDDVNYVTRFLDGITSLIKHVKI